MHADSASDKPGRKLEQRLSGEGMGRQRGDGPEGVQDSLAEKHGDSGLESCTGSIRIAERVDVAQAVPNFAILLPPPLACTTNLVGVDL